MPSQSLLMFSSSQRMLLAVCTLIIVLGAGVLIVDALLIRTSPTTLEDASGETSPPEITLFDVASRLGLQLSLASPDAELLHNVLASFAEFQADGARIGPVMTRSDAHHRLWLFEFDIDETLLIAPSHNATHNVHSGTITRLGMVIQLNDGRLPRWVQDGGREPPQPPWNDGALQRLARIEDLRLAIDQSFVVALARPGAFGLLEQIQRERSQEFHPGLRNSALHIDGQRIIDVINLLDSDAPDLPPLYRVEVEIKMPEIRKPQISERLEAVRAKNERELARLRAELEAQRQTREAKHINLSSGKIDSSEASNAQTSEPSSEN